MADILLQDAVKTYNNGKVVAVNHLTVECRDHEFLAILGPSGAGKTSILKMIAGIEELSEGRLFIGGADMTNEPSQNRNVSMVFEDYALYPHMTVRQNLAFPLKAPKRARKFSAAEIDAKVEEWARTVGLDELLDRKPGQLSGGQRQRVSLARALVRSPEPNVILMDEPIARLDAKLRNGMRAELKRLKKDLGVTVIYVTHDYTEAMAMADRIVVVNDGILMQEGPPREIYNDPANEFVASIVGEPPMNLLAGEVEKYGGEYFFRIFDDRIPLPDGVRFAGKADVGIRPSEIAASREKPDTPCLKGEILEILPTGAKQIMEVNVSGKMTLVKVRRDASYQKGDRVFLTPDIEKICLFDSESKLRLDRMERKRV